MEFLLLVGVMFLAGLTELGPSQWLPAYVEQAVGSSRSSGAVGLLLLGVMMAIGRLSNSYLARHASPKKLVAAGSTLAVAALVLSALPAPPFHDRLPGHARAGCVGHLAVGSVAGRQSLSPGRAAVYAILQTSGNVGGLVGPLAIGLTAQATGLRLAMGLLALGPAAIVLLLALDRQLPASRG